MSYIGGYALALDMTAREIQASAKVFPGLLLKDRTLSHPLAPLSSKIVCQAATNVPGDVPAASASNSSGMTTYERVIETLTTLFPLWVGVGFLAQYLIKPILGYLIATSLKLSAPLATGLILVSCCPGGQASATYISKGKVALSVLMTTWSPFREIASYFPVWIWLMALWMEKLEESLLKQPTKNRGKCVLF